MVGVAILLAAVTPTLDITKSRIARPLACQQSHIPAQFEFSGIAVFFGRATLQRPSFRAPA